jgi:hypothetical protein
VQFAPCVSDPALVVDFIRGLDRPPAHDFPFGVRTILSKLPFLSVRALFNLVIKYSGFPSFARCCHCTLLVCFSA